MKKINVAFIDSRHKWGGVSTKILVLGRGFEKKGISVHLFVRHNGPNIIRYAKYLSNVIPVNFGPDYNPLTILMFKRQFKKRSITHVITNVKKEITTAAVAASSLGLINIRLIGGTVDLRDTKKDRKMLEKYADFIHVNSNWLLNELASKYDFFPVEKTKAIWNGTDYYHFTPAHKIEMRKKFGIDRDDLVVGYIGQFSNLKKIDVAVEVLSGLFKKYENLKIMLAGEGELFAKISDFVEKNDLSRKIILTGYLENISEVLSVLDIGLLPSLSEGLPNSLLEYMSAGIPQVASAVGGIPEAVVDKETGFLFNPGDWEEMKAKILLLLENENLRKRMSDASRKRFLEHFSGRVFAEKFIEEFL